MEGLRLRLFLSRLVLGNFLFDLLTPPWGLLDRLLDLLRFSLSFPAAFLSLLALISALTPLFINKNIVKTKINNIYYFQKKKKFLRQYCAFC
jgi:hypothetical protein